METRRPNNQDRTMRVLSGRALDRELGALTENWTPRRAVDTEAIGRVPDPAPVHAEDFGTDHLDDEPTANQELVESWQAAAEHTERVGGKPMRWTVYPHKRLYRDRGRRKKY